MIEGIEEARCIECGDFYNKAAMKGNLCFSCEGEEDAHNKIDYSDDEK